MRLVVGDVDSSIVRILISFLARCSRLAKKSGLRFLVIYLKAQYVNLQQAVGGMASVDMTPLGARVARRGSYLPAWIPILHRVRIRANDAKIIRLWMSLFSLYRVIEFPWTLKLATITDSGPNIAHLLPSASDFAKVFWSVVLENFGTDWLWDCLNDRLEAFQALIARPFYIPKSTPSTSTFLSGSPIGVMSGAVALLNSPLGVPYIEFLQLTKSISLLNWLEATAKAYHQYFRDFMPSMKCSIGKLGFKEEAAGKLRVFALVDCWTQWALKPLHDNLFAILRNIPQDGTFDQGKPLERFSEWKGKPLYSFDLSAATDRLPVLLQAVVLSSLLGSHFANLWMTLLTARTYTWNIGKESPWRSELGTSGSVMYSVGQPMGALTSWAMLAITHHFIVQWAAFRSGVIKSGFWFADYAVLGDDIVIGNKLVAHSYLEIMKDLGVGISTAKSLVSPDGTGLEFAKRFIANGVNLSPIPFLEYFASTLSLAAGLQVAAKYCLTVAQYLGLLGFSYKATARINSRFSRLNGRLRTALLAWFSPAGPRGISGIVEFISMRSTTSSVAIAERPLAIISLIQSLKDQLLSQLTQWAPLIKLASKMVTVDRTRAHYGTIKPGPDFVTVDFVTGCEGPLSPEMVMWVHSYQERVLRELYLDTASSYRDIVNALTDVDPASVALADLETILAQILDLERSLAEMPLPRTNLSVRNDPKGLSLMLKPTRWARLWEVAHRTLNRSPRTCEAKINPES
jgi:hypothetical protein